MTEPLWSRDVVKKAVEQYGSEEAAAAALSLPVEAIRRALAPAQDDQQ